MIEGIEDDPEPAPPTPILRGPDRPMVALSLGFYHYLQECADLVAVMSTDPRPHTRRLAMEWKLAARAIQTSFGKINP